MNGPLHLGPLDARLREELGHLAGAPVPSVAARVMERLPERRARSRRRPLVLAAAAAAALLAWAVPAVQREAEARRGAEVVRALTQPREEWLTLGAPLAASEEALREEARRLVEDTRRTASSLWDRLPLSSALSRHPE